MNTIAKLTVAAIAMAAAGVGDNRMLGRTGGLFGRDDTRVSRTPADRYVLPSRLPSGRACVLRHQADADHLRRRRQRLDTPDHVVIVERIRCYRKRLMVSPGVPPELRPGPGEQVPGHPETLSAVRHGRFTVLAVTLKGKKMIYHYPVPWVQSADGCVQSPDCDQSAGPISSA